MVRNSRRPAWLFVVAVVAVVAGAWYFGVYDTAAGKCNRGDLGACVVAEAQQQAQQSAAAESAAESAAGAATPSGFVPEDQQPGFACSATNGTLVFSAEGEGQPGSGLCQAAASGLGAGWYVNASWTPPPGPVPTTEVAQVSTPPQDTEQCQEPAPIGGNWDWGLVGPPGADMTAACAFLNAGSWVP